MFFSDGRLKTVLFSPTAERVLSINFDEVWKGELHASRTMLDREVGCATLLREARQDAAERIEQLNRRHGWTSTLREVQPHATAYMR